MYTGLCPRCKVNQLTGRGWCRTCDLAIRAAKRLSNPVPFMILAARSRAKRHSVPFSITEADIVIPSHCPILGIPLVTASGKRGSTPNSPSIDRIRPELGYVPGNVQVISHRANAIKNDATLAELERVGDWARAIQRTALLV